MILLVCSPGSQAFYLFICFILFGTNPYTYEPRGEPRLELGVLTRLWNYVELFWNSLNNAPSSIIFYLEMKVKVEVGVHDIRSRFTPRYEPYVHTPKRRKEHIYINQIRARKS